MQSTPAASILSTPRIGMAMIARNILTIRFIKLCLPAGRQGSIPVGSTLSSPNTEGVPVTKFCSLGY
jgi:hypothetical protein